MDKKFIKEAFITLSAAGLITFGSIAAIANEHFGDDDIRSAAYVLRTLEQNNSTLPLLIKKAEETGNGIAVEVEVAEGPNGEYIEIELYRNKEIIQVTCDLASGEILNVSQPKVMSSLIARICEQYETLGQNKISIEKAIRLAEIKTSGTAYGAEVENMDGWLCYKVYLLSDHKTLAVVVDPDNGRIISLKDNDLDDDDDRHKGDH